MEYTLHREYMTEDYMVAAWDGETLVGVSGPYASKQAASNLSDSKLDNIPFPFDENLTRNFLVNRTTGFIVDVQWNPDF